MGLIKRYIYILCFIGMSETQAQDSLQFHVVKTKQSLSSIANQYCQRIYGPKGGLAQILKLNPRIKNSNLIFPKETIIIPINDNCRLINMESPKEVNKTPDSIPLPITMPPEKTNIATNTTTKNSDRVLSIEFYNLFSTLEDQDNSNSSKAKFVSHPIYGFAVGLKTHWGHQLNSHLKLGYLNEHYQENQERDLKQSSVHRSLISLDLLKEQIHNSWIFGISTKIAEKTFIGKSDLEQINLIKAPILSYGLITEKNLYQFKEKRLSIGGRFNYLNQNKLQDLSIKDGYNYEFILKINDTWDTFPFWYSIGYECLKQDTNLTEHQETSYGLRLGVEFL
jgi:hypothetical protein